MLTLHCDGPPKDILLIKHHFASTCQIILTLNPYSTSLTPTVY